MSGTSCTLVAGISPECGTEKGSLDGASASKPGGSEASTGGGGGIAGGGEDVAGVERNGASPPKSSSASFDCAARASGGSATGGVVAKGSCGRPPPKGEPCAPWAKGPLEKGSVARAAGCADDDSPSSKPAAPAAGPKRLAIDGTPKGDASVANGDWEGGAKGSETGFVGGGGAKVGATIGLGGGATSARFIDVDDGRGKLDAER